MFLLETVGIDMSQERFRDLIHLFLYQVCKTEREFYKQNVEYSEIEKDKEILNILL